MIKQAFVQIVVQIIVLVIILWPTAFILQMITNKIAKFMPPYIMVYKSAIIGSVVCITFNTVLGLNLHIAFISEINNLLVWYLVADLILLSIINSLLIKDNTSKAIGLINGIILGAIILVCMIASQFILSILLFFGGFLWMLFIAGSY